MLEIFKIAAEEAAEQVADGNLLSTKNILIGCSIVALGACAYGIYKLVSSSEEELTNGADADASVPSLNEK